MRVFPVTRARASSSARSALAALAALLLASGAAPAAPAGEIAVVCDPSVAPYRELLESFSKTCECTVRLLPPEEAARTGFEERLRASGVRAVLAVGLQARAAVEGVRGFPVLLTMTPQTGRWVAAQPNRFGIEMALPPRRHLETMRLVFPRAQRIGVVYDPGRTGEYLLEAQGVAARLGLTLVTREVASTADVQRRLTGLRGEADVIWVLPDPTVLQGENIDLLLLASFESRTPLYGFARKYAELGAVAATYLDPAALGAQAADFLRRLPSGSAAAALRHQYARDGRLVLNQKIARKMGLTLGPGALEVADDVLR